MFTDAPILMLAGNGVIGQATARRFATAGHRVIVHHTGRRPLPAIPGIEAIVVAASPLPITSFPGEAARAAKGGVAVHFQCMGAPDGQAFVRAFDGIAKRLVLISSSDVYRAYGRFIRTEPGAPEPTPMTEKAPLRERLYPYREQARNPAHLLHWYEKLEAERAVQSASSSEVTVLRLPKVFGPDNNADLATVYGFAAYTHWRWTHGHVQNVAAAIARACTHPAAAGESFNLGEVHTPTIGERLALLPPSPDFPSSVDTQDFRQDLHTDTSKVRTLLEFVDEVDEPGAMRALAEAARGVTDAGLTSCPKH